MPDERIGRLEGAIDGLRHAQNLTIGAVGILGAFIAIFTAVVIGLGVYELQRIDQLNDKVSALPGQISAELRDLTKTLAATITAARQPAPQPEQPPRGGGGSDRSGSPPVGPREPPPVSKDPPPLR
jgi:hypothetical protein